MMRTVILRFDIGLGRLLAFERDEALLVRRLSQIPGVEQVEIRMLRTPRPVLVVALAVARDHLDEFALRASVGQVLGLRPADAGRRLDRPVEAAPADRRLRYLHGECPRRIRAEQWFSLIVRVVVTSQSGDVALAAFDVPAGGLEVELCVSSTEALVDTAIQSVLVPPDGDSQPVRFDLRFDRPGRHEILVTAWKGNYLGELRLGVEAVAERPADGEPISVDASISMKVADGAVSLDVRYDPRRCHYGFTMHGAGDPFTAGHQLSAPPYEAVARTVRRLDEVARSPGYTRMDTRNVLRAEGSTLWKKLLPEAFHREFAERLPEIKHLTIHAEHDPVPWELLHPRIPQHGINDFLVELFPVTRGVFGSRASTRLRLSPARFVLSDHPPLGAQAEVEELCALLGADQGAEWLIETYGSLMDLLDLGGFGLLHFAGHNDDGQVRVGGIPFTPHELNAADIAASAPLVFMNVCRADGQIPSYGGFENWAGGFLNAGAAAFVGSSWAVGSETAAVFARVVYDQLIRGEPLASAVKAARRAAEEAAPGDPTWLAYTVYGDPEARVAPAAEWIREGRE